MGPRANPEKKTFFTGNTIGALPEKKLLIVAKIKTLNSFFLKKKLTTRVELISNYCTKTVSDQEAN